MNSIPVRILFLFFLVLFLYNLDCGQKDPHLKTSLENDKTGAIGVFSDPTGTTIILNGLGTGLTIPDTLEDISLRTSGSILHRRLGT